MCWVCDEDDGGAGTAGKLVVPEFACPDAATLVKIASQDELFKQSNHNGDLLYVKVQKANGMIPVFNSEGMPEAKAGSFRYEEIRNQLRAGKHMVFMSVDTFRESRVFVEGGVKVQEVMFMQEVEHQGVSRFFYYGEEPRGDVVRATKVKSSCIVRGHVCALGLHANLIFPHENRDDAEEFVRVAKSFKKKKLFVSGMVMPVPMVVKEKGSSPRRVVSYDILVNEWGVQEELYDDVQKIVAKIASIDDVTFFRDMSTGEPLYPEYVRKMMWYSTAYVKMGDPVFNLIISGDPGTAKSTALGVHAKIFSVRSKTLIGSGGTKKGLIPSFSGDAPLDGALVNEPFFAPVDEFFSLSTSEGIAMGVEKIANAHRQYIRDLLPVVTRAPLRYPSAKDNDYECVMEASLMATDNLVPKTRVALQSLVEEDPATLRRFCVVWLGADVKTRVRQSPGGNVDDNMEFLEKYWLMKYGFKVREMKRFAEWFRSVVADVHVDGVRCMGIQWDAVADLMVDAKKESSIFLDRGVVDSFCRSVDYSMHIMGMVRCEAVMRAVYASNGVLPSDISVIDEDYVAAKELFREVMRDGIFLFNFDTFAPGIGSVGGSGVRRI